jgi:EmrB/QacA subfamily drug resistance transporter
MTPNPSQRMLLWLVAIGFFMEILDATIVNTALPEMALDLNASPLSMHSVVIAYSLTLAVFIPVSGWLADRFGIRKVFMAAIIIFTMGSILCALSNSLNSLIAFRVVQGIGGSMLLPIGRLAIIRAFPGDKFVGALSFVAMPALIAPLIGPVLGGWLVEYASWHWIFLINIPIGIVGLIATYKAMPEDELNEPSRFDFKGFFLLAGFMVSTSVSLDGLADQVIPNGVVLLLLVFGFACLATYFLHISKISNSFFSLKLFKIRSYTVGILGNLFSRIGSSSMPFLIPLYLQLSLKLSPFEAGLYMLPVAIAGILAKRFVESLLLGLGYRHFLMLNTFLVGLSMAMIGFMNVITPTWLRVILLFFFGIVNSMQFTAMNTVTLKDLDRKSSTGGNTLFSMVQMLAMSFAVASAGTILSAFNSYFGPQDTSDAFRYTFICMAIMTCISMFLFAQIPAKANETEPAKVSAGSET